MKKGMCPRCQSKEVYSGASISGKSGLHQNNTIPITSFTTAVLDNFVCGQCGYVESYIAKEKDLARIKRKWPLVF
jgi:predicted nucleic-acid-binding Zn-ribbon protein